MIDRILVSTFVGFIFWVTISIISSAIIKRENVCDKTYPINYIFYSKLFCEIKDEKENS